jgi:uncharacterized membrane protein YphA (DoxX/SURF4 family)
MTTPASDSAPVRLSDRAYVLLRVTFTVAPIAFGLDKFFDVLTDWEKYLAPWIADLSPGTAEQTMLAVGVIEIVAGILVGVAPRIGAPLVAVWLAGIIVNLVTTGEYYDIALRDVGLLAGAVALALMAWDRRERRTRPNHQPTTQGSP